MSAPLTIPTAQFRRLVKSVAIAAAKDEIRPILMGVKLDFDPKASTLTATATNWYQLHIATLDVTKNDGEAWSALVPAKWLSRWATEQFPRHNAGTPRKPKMQLPDVTIEPYNDRIRLITGDDRRSISLITGQYPGTEKLIKRKPTKAEIAEGPAGFNPVLFGGLIKAATTWGADGWNTLPMRTQTWGQLSPCQFDVVAHHGTLTMILMPVRLQP